MSNNPKGHFHVKVRRGVILSFMAYKRRSLRVELFLQVAAVREANWTGLVLNTCLEKSFAWN